MGGNGSGPGQGCGRGCAAARAELVLVSALRVNRRHAERTSLLKGFEEVSPRLLTSLFLLLPPQTFSWEKRNMWAKSTAYCLLLDNSTRTTISTSKYHRRILLGRHVPVSCVLCVCALCQSASPSNKAGSRRIQRPTYTGGSYGPKSSSSCGKMRSRCSGSTSVAPHDAASLRAASRAHALQRGKESGEASGTVRKGCVCARPGGRGRQRTWPTDALPPPQRRA